MTDGCTGAVEAQWRQLNPTQRGSGMCLQRWCLIWQLAAFPQMDSRGKSLPVIGSSNYTAQAQKRELSKLCNYDSHWLEYRLKWRRERWGSANLNGPANFTCFLDGPANLPASRPWATHYNHSDCEPFPGISKDTQFNKHLWHLLCESGTVSGWC